jgi:hypothetical protein
MDRTTRELTAEARRAQSKESSITKYSKLRDLCGEATIAPLVAALPRWVQFVAFIT